MSITKRVKHAILEIQKGDYENAIYQIVSAVDGTAKKENLSNKNNERNKIWLANNRDIITRVTFKLIEFQGDMRFQTKNKVGLEKIYSFEDAIYTLVRCALLHEGEIDELFEFTDTFVGVSKDGKIQMPPDLATGLLMAVISAPVNKDLKLDSPLSFVLSGETFFFNDLWGKKALILKIFRKAASNT